MVFVLCVGLVLTLSYVLTGKLWPAVLAHMLWDIVPAL
jgi:membrane protease YdiL (CAAX protease family)